jgi:muramoyltetrapeptide carboxypeptidase
MQRPVKPPRLCPGDRVAVVAPSGPVEPERVAGGLALLRSWDLKPVEMPHLYDRSEYLAGDDTARLADLQRALAEPALAGVFTARGGYGAQRIIDDLDLSCAVPKVFVGFSDVTALHLALWRRMGLVTFHGPGLSWRPDRTGESSAESLRRAVMEREPIGNVLVPTDGPKPVALVGGEAEGPLLGGNLALLAASVGTPDEPDLNGAVVLLEEVGEPMYRIDRMLTQLLRAGVLARASGVVFGDTAPQGGSADDLMVLLGDRLGRLGVPVLYGLPVGHRRHQQTVPLGVKARLHAGNGVLSITEAATSG